MRPRMEDYDLLESVCKLQNIFLVPIPKMGGIIMVLISLLEWDVSQ